MGGGGGGGGSGRCPIRGPCPYVGFGGSFGVSLVFGGREGFLGFGGRETQAAEEAVTVSLNRKKEFFVFFSSGSGSRVSRGSGAVLAAGLVSRVAGLAS